VIKRLQGYLGVWCLSKPQGRLSRGLVGFWARGGTGEREKLTVGLLIALWFYLAFLARYRRVRSAPDIALPVLGLPRGLVVTEIGVSTGGFSVTFFVTGP
jgi:hypothetical protein